MLLRECDEKDRTYRESTQLPSAALLENSDDLRQLAGSGQYTRTSLQPRQRLDIHDILTVKRRADSYESRNPCTYSWQPFPTILKQQRRDSHILHQDQRRLAIRAKRESMANIISQRNQITPALEQVRQKADTLCGLRVEDLEQLRDLDDGRRSDDTDTEAFADGELDAVGRRKRVDVEDKCLVAVRREQRAARFDNRFGQVVGEGLER